MNRLHKTTLFFCFFLYVVIKGINLDVVNLNTGQSCSDSCISPGDLNSVISSVNKTTSLFLHIYGPLSLVESLLFTEQEKLTIIGEGEGASVDIDPQASQDFSTINITVYSKFKSVGVSFSVPLLLYGKTKQQIKEITTNTSKISHDYQCYGGKLARFYYYNSHVNITQCSFLPVYSGGANIVLGDDVVKTFFDRVDIVSSSFQNNWVDQMPTTTDYDSNIQPINMTIYNSKNTVLNRFTISGSRFTAAKILNKGVIVKLEDISNFWSPILFLADSQDLTIYSMLPLVQNMPSIDAIRFTEHFQHCKKYFSTANVLNKRSYAIADPSATLSPKSDAKKICIICKSCEGCLDFLNLQDCWVVFNSTKALDQYQTLQNNAQNTIASNPFFLTINFTDTLYYDGTCQTCSFESIATTIIGRGDLGSDTLFCPTGKPNEPILTFSVVQLPPPAKKRTLASPVPLNININNIVFANSIDFENSTLNSVGVDINFNLNECSVSSDPCITVVINGNTFRNLNTAISLRSPQHCSSVSILYNHFLSNKQTLYYSDRPKLNSCQFISDHLFGFTRNDLTGSGAVDIIRPDGYSHHHHHRDNHNHHGHHDHHGRHHHGSHGNKRRSLNKKPIFGKKKESSKGRLVENKDNKKRSIVFSDSMLPTNINFAIEYNTIITDHSILSCSNLYGISFSQNRVEWTSTNKGSLIQSSCNQFYVFGNNFTTSYPSIPPVSIKMTGSEQIISTNNITGKFNFVLEAGAHDESQLTTYTENVSNFLVSNNILSGGMLFEIPETFVQGATPRSGNPSYKDQCSTFCPTLHSKCWKCLRHSTKIKTPDENPFKCFEEKSLCYLNTTQGTSLTCQMCIFDAFTWNHTNSLGNRVFVVDNLLEGCDLSNFLFKSDDQNQCSVVSSRNVHFVNNYIRSSSCSNTHRRRADGDSNFRAIKLKANDPTEYLNEKGKLKLCKENQQRFDWLNPPKCCIEFDDEENSESGNQGYLSKKNIYRKLVKAKKTLEQNTLNGMETKSKKKASPPGLKSESVLKQVLEKSVKNPPKKIDENKPQISVEKGKTLNNNKPKTTAKQLTIELEKMLKDLLENVNNNKGDIESPNAKKNDKFSAISNPGKKMTPHDHSKDKNQKQKLKPVEKGQNVPAFHSTEEQFHTRYKILDHQLKKMIKK